MTTLLANQHNALATLQRSLAKTSLRDLVRAKRASMLLVDASGSMSDTLETGARKIDELRKVVAILAETHAVPMVAFGSSVDLVRGDIPEPSGGTPLDRALDYAKASGATHVVVVSDGHPDNPDAAMDAATRFGGIVDSFFIGNDFDRGAGFLRRLAELTGGATNLTDLLDPKQLASGIAGLLGDGRETV